MSIFNLFKRKNRIEISELNDEELLSHLQVWLTQLKSVSKIYLFCGVGAFCAPPAWFSFFYFRSFRKTQNPLLKGWLKIPKLIIFAETIVQFALAYASIALTQVGAETSGLGFSLTYFMFVAFFILVNLIFSKVHALAIKYKQQYFIDALSGNEEKITKSLLQKGRDFAKSQVDRYKQDIGEVTK
ncbi:hypothetical protein [Pseudomonas ficuserectae]|uniref:hypothetical protein n=1 Tax=Pseudomonas ficuserectae TaxID=53410 RepID=UPI0006D625FD|nr:hypothetical protein [Pseudomonas ficuserectae]KPX40930.1 Unknown protein sequence [Pseudomonas ficuserectae]RMS33515.1 hypothetical protein ALP68_01717 [Pseudomonas ficuserectae]RMS41570.1 hypothetical protein ALP67_00662 [Pseudomonas ficuserectae]